MKILFLTPQVPYPPQQGAALRNWGLISGLATRHDVAVLSFLSTRQAPEPDDPLSAVAEGTGVVLHELNFLRKMASAERAT